MKEALTESKTSKYILLAGVFTFSILFFYAGCFYKERTIFLDASFHLFSILKDGNFAIQVNRFGAIFTQAVPLVASKMGLSLNAITFLYSESFIFLNFISFLFILLVFRNHRMALGLLLFNVLMTTDSFYWIQCELMQGITFFFLFMAYLENIFSKDKLPLNSIFFLPLFVFFLIFFYPLMPFVIFFALIYAALNSASRRRQYLVLAGCFLLLFYLKGQFFKNHYDTEAMQRIDNFYALFPNYFKTKSFSEYIHYFTTDYFLVPLSLILIILFYSFKKEFLKLALILSFYVGFSILMIGTYPDGADKFYLEPQYSILSFFVVLPLAVEVFQAVKNQVAKFAIISIVIIISLVRIWNAHDDYTARLNWFRKTVNETAGAGKVIIKAESIPLKTVLMTWGSAYEFWLLSTMEQGASRSIIIEERQYEFDDQLNKNKALITKWGAYNYSDLNGKYFRFSDTSYYKKY